MSAARVSGGARHAAAASKHGSKPGMGTQVAAPCTDVDYLKMRDSMLHGLPSAGRNGTAAGAAAAAAAAISAPSNTSSPTKGHQATTNAVFAALASLASRNGTHGTMNAAKLMNVPGAAAAALANGLANNTGGLAAAAAAASAAAAKPTSSAVGSKRAAPTTSEVNSGRGGGATKKSKRNAATSPTSSARGNSGSGTRVSAGLPRMDADMGSDSDEEDWEQAMGGDGRGGNEDPDRARMRREKNRVAARKCRAKKVQFMARMQQELKDLTAQNNELKMQVVTWHRMFSREVKLRDAMKRLIQAVWGPTGAAAATGQSASDVLLGLEAGTLDVNTLIPAGGAPAPPPPPVGHAGTAPALPAPPPPPPDVALLDPSLSRLPSLLLEGPLDPSFPPGSATSTTVGLDPMMFGMMGQQGHPPYPPMPGMAPAGYPGSTSNLPHPNMLAPPPPPVGGAMPVSPLTGCGMQDELAASMGGLTSIAAPTPVSIDLQPRTAVSGPVTTPSAFAAASAAATAAAAAAAVVARTPGLPARPSVHQPGEGLPMPGGLPCSPIGIPPLAEQSSLRAGAMSPTGSQHADGRHPHAPKRMRPSFNSAASSPFAAASGMPTGEDAHPGSAAGAASAAAAADAAAREISFAGGTATTAAAAAALNSSAVALPGPTPLHGTSGLTQLSSSGILRMPTAQLGLGLDLGSAASASMELGTFLTSLTRNSTPPPGLTGPSHMHAPRAPTPLRLQQLGGDDAAGHAGASAHASGMGAGDSVVLPAAQLLRTGPASLSEDATLGVRPAGYSSVARVSGGLLMPKPDPSSLMGGSLSSTHSEGTGADLAKVTSLGLAQAGLGSVLQAADSLNMLRADTLPGAGALLPPASPLVVHGTSSGSAVAKLESRELSLLTGGKAVSGELLVASLNMGVSLPGSGMPGMQRNMSLDWLAMALDYSGRQSPGMGPAAAPAPAGMTAAAAAARPAGAVSPAPGAPTAVAHKSGSSSPLPAAQGVGA